jgi:hypothetical protein
VGGGEGVGGGGRTACRLQPPRPQWRPFYTQDAQPVGVQHDLDCRLFRLGSYAAVRFSG